MAMVDRMSSRDVLRRSTGSNRRACVQVEVPQVDGYSELA